MNYASSNSKEHARDVEKVLAALDEYGESVVVYVPATMGVSKEADNSIWVDKTAKALSNLFGGSTIMPSQGTWVASDGELVKENTTMVKAFTKHLTGDDIAKVVDMCRQLKSDLRQEAVALEVNGSMYFV